MQNSKVQSLHLRGSGTGARPPGAGTTRPQESKVNDDVSSEAHEIREQARKSRDPEAGENIL